MVPARCRRPYCYLKPDFLPVQMSWFEQEQIGFEPSAVQKEVRQ